MRLFLFSIFLHLHITLFASVFNLGFDLSTQQHISKKDLMIASDILFKKIAAKSDVKLKHTFYSNVKSMLNDFEKNRLDFITCSPLDTVKYFDLNKLENGFAAASLEKEKNFFIVIANKKSKIEKIEDLQGKKIGFYKYDELAKVYVKTLMHEHHKKDTTKMEAFESYQRAILKTFFGKLDAAFVTMRSFKLVQELNPQISSRLKIVEKTNLPSIAFGFYRKGVDQTIKEKVNDVSFNLHKDVTGQQILLIYKAEAIREVKLEEIEPIKNLYLRSLQFEDSYKEPLKH